ncbi:MAG: single-stranded DNA-binding protein [Pseudomonadota bacterium]
MSKSLNRVQLLGHVGKEPDVRTLPNGEMVVNFSVATSESWKDKNTGEPKSNTEWHNIVCFKWQAKIAADFLRSGSKVFIEGSLKTEEWQTKDGEKRKTTKIYAGDIILCGDKSDAPKRESTAKPKQQSLPAQDDSFNDDIPF